MQEEIGACTLDDIAVAMACPVVAVHPDRMQWIIYGGAIHFSKDFLTLDGGRKCFGRMVDIDGETWDAESTWRNPYLISLSQEHASYNAMSIILICAGPEPFAMAACA